MSQIRFSASQVRETNDITFRGNVLMDALKLVSDHNSRTLQSLLLIYQNCHPDKVVLSVAPYHLEDNRVYNTSYIRLTKKLFVVEVLNNNRLEQHVVSMDELQDREQNIKHQKQGGFAVLTAAQIRFSDMDIIAVSK